MPKVWKRLPFDLVRSGTPPICKKPQPMCRISASTCVTMLGLFAFLYGFLHLSTWIGLDKFFSLAEMLNHDVRKRPFITAGFTGFVLMIPLALTSTAGWIRRLAGNAGKGCTG